MLLRRLRNSVVPARKLPAIIVATKDAPPMPQMAENKLPRGNVMARVPTMIILPRMKVAIAASRLLVPLAICFLMARERISKLNVLKSRGIAAEQR